MKVFSFLNRPLVILSHASASAKVVKFCKSFKSFCFRDMFQTVGPSRKVLFGEVRYTLNSVEIGGLTLSKHVKIPICLTMPASNIIQFLIANCADI